MPGKKSNYDEVILPHIEEIEKAFLEGATEKMVYEAFGINHTSWANYKKSHTEFATLIRKSKLKAIQDVDNALFMLATGQATSTEYRSSDKVVDGEVYTLEFKKTVKNKPDAQAIAMWMRNHSADTWHDRDRKQEQDKSKEIKLKEEAAKAQNWMLDEDVESV